MDMEDNKDILLDQLFAEAAQTEIADNGFTRQVMRRLPSRAERYSRIWTIICSVIAVALLTYFKAWNLFVDAVINTVCLSLNIDWLHVLTLFLLFPIIAMIVSSVFAYREFKV